MKLFLSWSGEKSHKVAVVFRDWFPSVIQSLVPYVSSEDIDKGTRWSTDIAKELEDSSFGILCVTKDNRNAPWLTFEAGALSKTVDKAFVSPFLFNVRRSEVDGPLLQFQSTIFEKDDIRKLLRTLNKASGADGLTDERLERAFEVWYPNLEESLNKIPKAKKDIKEPKASKDDQILEEILELSRLNQKLLRDPGKASAEQVDQIASMIGDLHYSAKTRRGSPLRHQKRLHPGMVEELLHTADGLRQKDAGPRIVLALFRNDFPWIYDVGMDVVRLLRSNKSQQEKRNRVEAFLEMVDFTFSHPMVRDVFGIDRDYYRLGYDLPHILRRTLLQDS